MRDRTAAPESSASSGRVVVDDVLEACEKVTALVGRNDVIDRLRDLSHQLVRKLELEALEIRVGAPAGRARRLGEPWLVAISARHPVSLSAEWSWTKDMTGLLDVPPTGEWLPLPGHADRGVVLCGVPVAGNLCGVLAVEPRVRSRTIERAYRTLACSIGAALEHSTAPVSRPHDSGGGAQRVHFESVGRLFAGLVHPMANGLFAVRAEASLIARAPEAPGVALRAAAILSATARLAGILSEAAPLVSIASEEGDSPLVDINSCAAAVAELLGQAAGEHVEIAFELDDRSPVAALSRSTLVLVLVNLCFAAREALARGGRVVLATMALPGRGAAEIQLRGVPAPPRGEGGEAGSGIVLDELGDPWLGTVYGLVTRAGGEVDVDADATAFTLTVRMPAAGLSIERPPLAPVGA